MLRMSVGTGRLVLESVLATSCVPWSWPLKVTTAEAESWSATMMYEEAGPRDGEQRRQDGV